MTPIRRRFWAASGLSRMVTDLGYLIPMASSADLDDARKAVKLMQARDNWEQDVADLNQFILDAGNQQP
jgi:hypothetical protein